MSLQRMRWRILPAVDDVALGRMPDLPPLIVQLLRNRGINSPGAAREFLEGRAASPSPFQLKGVNEAVTRLRQAIGFKERVAVYGDFDADGVTSTVLMVETLSALGAEVRPYIPDRVDEGYGLNLGALRRLYREGVRLVVTVDCGIRSTHEVSEASKGLDIIITDHHAIGPTLPPALATINPKQPGCPYGFEMLAGVGVAYKLAQALLRVGGRMGAAPPMHEESLLDLVALGTVADLAPLEGENRTLVRKGLEVLNQPRRLGVEALMAEAGLRRGEVDAAAIGFRLGPRINAAGRIDKAMLAYNLLASRDALETKRLAERLDKLNRRRQEVTEETYAAAEKQVLDDHPDAYLYMAASPEFEPGVVGLAASRLTETYNRPSVVVKVGERWSRGSCRSITEPEFHITHALDKCADILERHGGHAAAAGFTVETRRLEALRERLQAEASRELEGKDLRPVLEVDAEIALEEVDWAVQALLGQLEPCGVSNPQPVLVSRNVEVREVRAIGSEQKHVRLTLRDERGASWDAVAFRRGDIVGRVPRWVDVAYTLEINEWNQRKRLQLNVQDLRPAGGLPGAS